MLPLLVGMEKDAALWKVERYFFKRLNTDFPKTLLVVIKRNETVCTKTLQ